MCNESNTTSKVRAWAEKQIQLDKKEPSVIKILSDSIIYSLTRFSVGPHYNGDKDDFITEDVINNVLAAYSGDATLFEIGCYLYFHIDFWHVQKIKDKYRDDVYYGYLIKKFMEIFEDSLNMKNSHLIINNRLGLYGNLIKKEELERIDFYLNQLVLRTRNNTLPKIHDFEDFPVMVFGAIEELVLKIELTAFQTGMISACFENLKFFYGSMPDARKA